MEIMNESLNEIPFLDKANHSIPENKLTIRNHPIRSTNNTHLKGILDQTSFNPNIDTLSLNLCTKQDYRTLLNPNTLNTILITTCRT